MGMKIKKRRVRKKKQPLAEPREVMGMGFNLEESMRAAVMGNGTDVEVLYIIRENRPEDQQGAYPLDQLSMAFFLSFCGLMLENAELIPEVDGKIREETPPDGVTRLVSCGPPDGLQMWGAIQENGMFSITVGATFAQSHGEKLTRGDLQACAQAINAAFETGAVPAIMASGKSN